MKTLKLAIFLGLMVAISACAPVTTIDSTTASKTPAQKIAAVCPIVQDALSNVQLLILPLDLEAKLGVASLAVNTVCNAPTIDPTSVQTLIDTGIPALAQVLKNSSLPTDKINGLLLILDVQKLLLKDAIAAVQAVQ